MSPQWTAEPWVIEEGVNYGWHFSHTAVPGEPVYRLFLYTRKAGKKPVAMRVHIWDEARVQSIIVLEVAVADAPPELLAAVAGTFSAGFPDPLYDMVKDTLPAPWHLLFEDTAAFVEEWNAH